MKVGSAQKDDRRRLYSVTELLFSDVIELSREQDVRRIGVTRRRGRCDADCAARASWKFTTKLYNRTIYSALSCGNNANDLVMRRLTLGAPSLPSSSWTAPRCAGPPAEANSASLGPTAPSGSVCSSALHPRHNEMLLQPRAAKVAAAALLHSMRCPCSRAQRYRAEATPTIW